MDSFLKMDIFFFIASAEALILGAMVAYLIWRILKILKHVEKIAAIAGSEAEHLKEDVAFVRGRLLGVADTIFSFIPRRRKKKAEAEKEE